MPTLSVVAKRFGRSCAVALLAIATFLFAERRALAAGFEIEPTFFAACSYRSPLLSKAYSAKRRVRPIDTIGPAMLTSSMYVDVCEGSIGLLW
jgi:hypothetical protein